MKSISNLNYIRLRNEDKNNLTIFMSIVNAENCIYQMLHTMSPLPREDMIVPNGYSVECKK